jgi:HK97 family phage portal protein
MRFRGWNFSSIRPIAQTGAGQDFVVARRVRGPKGKAARPGFKHLSKEHLPLFVKSAGDLEVFDEHPLLDVFNNPNPVMVRWHMVYITIASLELTGRSHWWLTVDENDRPVIWPIPPSWVVAKHERDKPFSSWLVNPGGDARQVEIPAEEMVYFFYPDPGNPLGFVSPMQAQSRAVIADEAIQDAQASSFRNGCWPGLVVIAGEAVDDDGEKMGRPLLEREQRQQIYAAIKRGFAGVDKYDSPIILDRLIQDVKPLTTAPREMDFTNSAKSTKSRITQGYGLNQYIMGEIEGVNRASAAESKHQFADFCLNPKLELISQTLTKSVATRMSNQGEQLYCWIDPYRPADAEQTRADFQVGIAGQCVTKNEVREKLLGLPALKEGGDEMAGAANPGGAGMPIGANLPPEKRRRLLRAIRLLEG